MEENYNEEQQRKTMGTISRISKTTRKAKVCKV